MREFISGLLIGACDLVPGISGGTMALILGIYEPLMNAISEVRKFSFKNLKFLLLVLGGIVTSILMLSSFFHMLLQSEGKGYLYSLFFGLVLGSAWFVGKEIEKWNGKTLLLLAGGALAAWGVTHVPVLIQAPEGVLFYVWLVVSGAMAVLAMLLPGISGSYIMILMGPYPLVIESLSQLSRKGDLSALKVLLPVGGGILIGSLLFAKWISYALKHFRAVTLALLLGFMIGATTTIVPEFSSFISVGLIFLGMGIVLGLETKVSTRYKIKA